MTDEAIDAEIKELSKVTLGAATDYEMIRFERLQEEKWLRQPSVSEETN